MTGGRVLVVDDDAVLRESIVRLLEEEGYTVDAAADGVDALARIHERRPDAILLDVLMPRMNGKQLLRALRRSKDNARIAVVVMTAVSGMMPQHAAVDATEMVEKPFDVDELLNKVALAVCRTRLLDEAGGRADEPSGPGGRGGDRGLVLIVSTDQGFLEQVDHALIEGDLAPLSLTRGSPDLARLARVLEPRAVVVDLSERREDGVRAVEALRLEPCLARVPILACAVELGLLERWRPRLHELAVEEVSRADLVARIFEVTAT